MATTAPVTIEQAAAILGVSASTIRRRIKAGALRVEEARRPQGVVWLVHLPPGTAPASATATVDTAPVDTTATTQPTPADAIAAMIQATLTPIIAPLVGELAASRQANQQLTDQLLGQAETIGNLRAELATLRIAASSESPVRAREAPKSVEPTTKYPDGLSASPDAVGGRRAGDRRCDRTAGGAEVSRIDLLAVGGCVVIGCVIASVLRLMSGYVLATIALTIMVSAMIGIPMMTVLVIIAGLVLLVVRPGG